MWKTLHQLAIPPRLYQICGWFIPWLAIASVVVLTVGWIWGFGFAPADYQQGNSYRIIYLHVPAAIWSMGIYASMAVAAFIRDGHYHRHVRRMRQIYQQNMETYTCWVRQYFPAEICVTRPQGSFLLWVELPETVDMVCVSKQLCRLKIQAAAGSLFSASGKYRNCLRINVALPPTEKNREALRKMGEAIVIAMEE